MGCFLFVFCVFVCVVYVGCCVMWCFFFLLTRQTKLTGGGAGGGGGGAGGGEGGGGGGRTTRALADALALRDMKRILCRRLVSGSVPIPCELWAAAPGHVTLWGARLTPVLVPQVDTASEVEELDIDVAPAPCSTAGRGAARLQVFISRYR